LGDEDTKVGSLANVVRVVIAERLHTPNAGETVKRNRVPHRVKVNAFPQRMRWGDFKTEMTRAKFIDVELPSTRPTKLNKITFYLIKTGIKILNVDTVSRVIVEDEFKSTVRSDVREKKRATIKRITRNKLSAFMNRETSDTDVIRDKIVRKLNQTGLLNRCYIERTHQVYCYCKLEKEHYSNDRQADEDGFEHWKGRNRNYHQRCAQQQQKPLG
jgi:hypothetical protein